LVLMNNKM